MTHVTQDNLQPEGRSSERPAAPALRPGTRPVAPGPAWFDGLWPQERTDMRPLPSLRFERLPNGVRVVFMKNERPAGRVALFLDVQAGAFMEGPGEAGFAHIIEHVAFDGTRRFPAGHLIPMLQRQGLDPVDDVNAYTDISETVYQIHTFNDRESLETGVAVLRDMAGDVMFDEDEVAKEKAVILQEHREGSDLDAKLDDEWLRFLYPASVRATNVIGEEETVEGSSVETLRAFYRKWYHPERMILVAVGDVDGDELMEVVRAEFGTLPAGGELPWVTDFGAEPAPGRDAIVQKRPGTRSGITYSVLHPACWRPDTLANEADDVVNMLVRIALEKQLDKMSDERPHLWSAATFDDEWLRGYTPNATLAVETDFEHEREALEALSTWLRRIRREGITMRELGEAKRAAVEFLETNLTEYVNMESYDHAQRMVDGLNNDRVLTSPFEDLERFVALSDTLTLERVNRALHEMLSSGVERLGLATPGKMETDELKRIWWGGEASDAAASGSTDAAGAASVDDADEADDTDDARSSVLFPYADPVEGEVPADCWTRHDLKGLEAPLFEASLPNNTRLWVARAPSDRKRVRLTWVQEGGLRDFDEETVLTLRLADMVATKGGLGRLTAGETQDAVFDAGVGFDVTIGEHTRRITVEAPVRKLALALDVFETAWRETGISEAARVRTMSLLKEDEDARRLEISTLSASEKMPFFTGASARTKFLLTGDLEERPNELLEEVVRRTRLVGAGTLVVTGDIDPASFDEVRMMLARRVAGLPVLGALVPPEKPVKDVFPSGKAKVLYCDSEGYGQADVTAAWHVDAPVSGFRRVVGMDRLYIDLAALAVNEHLRVEVRERAGLAYSPDCYFSVQSQPEGFGLFMMTSATRREDAEALMYAFHGTADSLAAEGVDEETLERLVLPARALHKVDLQDPVALHERLAKAVTRGFGVVEGFVDAGALYDRVTLSGLNEALRKVFSAPSAGLTVLG